MKLYVMRHGPAEEDADSGMDADRALTASGRERVESVARALLEAHEEPFVVFTSPLVRAVQTAEIVAVATNLSDREGTVHARRELAPGAGPISLARRLASQGKRRVMFVGHEPDLSGLVATLLGAEMGRPFEKSMVVGLHISPNSERGRLRFVLEPKTLQIALAPGATPEA
jgi:phosphohistidine phosphatase